MGCCPPGPGRPSPERQDGARSPLTLERDEKALLDLVTIPAGDFLMGSDGADAIVGDGEGPPRRVHLSTYAIAPATVINREFATFVRATHYVTEAEQEGFSFVFYLQMPDAARKRARHVASGLPWWMPVMHACWQRPEGSGSHIYDRLDHPVVHVSWNDAKLYVAWLSRKTGKTYRLLSDSEREYITRAGTTTPFWWGSTITPTQANYDANKVYAGGGQKGVYREKTVPVDSFNANPWGFYNVSGNVWEWVEDCHESALNGVPADGSPRPATANCANHTYRGGSHLSDPDSLRSAARLYGGNDERAGHVGLRVARRL